MRWLSEGVRDTGAGICIMLLDFMIPSTLRILGNVHLLDRSLVQTHVLDHVCRYPKICLRCSFLCADPLVACRACRKVHVISGITNTPDSASDLPGCTWWKSV